MAERTGRLSIAVDPAVLAKIKRAADELGVSVSAWSAMRLAEAARAQDRVSSVMESMGRDLASLIADSGGADET